MSLMGVAVSFTKDEVLDYIQTNDVKFVRLLFCDTMGAPKNVAVMADYLPQVFETGAAFDTSALNRSPYYEAGGLFLHPDPATFAVLPWRPQSGRAARMYCNVLNKDKRPFDGDCRGLLREVRQRAYEKGFLIQSGGECEFYLFEQDEERYPTLIPHDTAGYFDIAPLDKCENARRDMCLALEELGMSPMGSYHERGPGQNTIWCRATDILSYADDIITYKTVVRTIAAQHGLFASFAPCPLGSEYDSSLFLNFTLENVSGDSRGISEETCFSFIAGIARRIPELSLFLQPSTNSYARLQNTNALKYLSWQGGPPSQVVRIPYEEEGIRRMELGGFDALCNPYYILSFLLAAGLEGIEDALTLEGIEGAVRDGDLLLPNTLGEALDWAQNSSFIKTVLPQATLERFFLLKKEEWIRYSDSPDKLAFEQSQYFAQI